MVIERNGMHYIVRVAPGICWHRHIEQMVRGAETSDEVEHNQQMTDDNTEENHARTDYQDTPEIKVSNDKQDGTVIEDSKHQDPERRYPLRERKQRKV